MIARWGTPMVSLDARQIRQWNTRPGCRSSKPEQSAHAYAAATPLRQSCSMDEDIGQTAVPDQGWCGAFPRLVVSAALTIDVLTPAEVNQLARGNGPALGDVLCGWPVCWAGGGVKLRATQRRPSARICDVLRGSVVAVHLHH